MHPRVKSDPERQLGFLALPLSFAAFSFRFKRDHNCYLHTEWVTKREKEMPYCLKKEKKKKTLYLG